MAHATPSKKALAETETKTQLNIIDLLALVSDRAKSNIDLNQFVDKTELIAKLLVDHLGTKSTKSNRPTIKYNLHEDSDLVIQVDLNQIPNIVRNGFKNAHQTNRSKMTHAMDFNNRRRVENRLMNLSDEPLPPEFHSMEMELRAKYGYLNLTAPVDLGTIYMHMQPYGNVAVFLKSQVKARSTYTIDDSLQLGRRIEEEGPENYRGTFADKEIQVASGSAYYEAQFLGKLTWNDVQFLVVDPTFPVAKLTELYQLGVPVYRGRLINYYNRLVRIPMHLLYSPGNPKSNENKIYFAAKIKKTKNRRLAAFALSDQKDINSVRTLLLLVNDPDLIVRIHAFRGLARSSNAEAFKWIKDHLASQDDEVITEVAYAIKENILPNYLEWISELVRQKKHMNILNRLITISLAESDDLEAWKIITHAFEHCCEMFVLRTLGQRSTQSSFDLLIKSLRKPDYQLQSTAMTQLAMRKDKFAQEYINNHLFEYSAQLRSIFYSEISKSKEPYSFEILKSVQSKESDYSCRLIIESHLASQVVKCNSIFSH